MKKCEFVTTDIYRKIYQCIPIYRSLIYRTPMYWYKYIYMSNAIYRYFRYIVAIATIELRSNHIVWMALKAGRTLSRSLVKWCEVTHQEFLRDINLNTSATVGTQGDAGWVESFHAWCDITAVCGPTAAFRMAISWSPGKVRVTNFAPI